MISIGRDSEREVLSDVRSDRRPASWTRTVVICIGSADMLVGCAGKLVGFAAGMTVGCVEDTAVFAGCGVSQLCPDMHLRIAVGAVLKRRSHDYFEVAGCGKRAVNRQYHLGCRRCGSRLRGAPALLAAADTVHPCWLRRRGTGRVSPQRVLMNPR